MQEAKKDFVQEGINKIPIKVRKSILSYIKELINIHDDNLLSIIMYGSTVTGEYIKGKSDVNLLVILKNLGIKELKKSLKIIKVGLKKRISTPLMFSKEYMTTSCDVFPIEFLELKEKHTLLWGEDILNQLEISPKDLRLECEKQLKGKLLRIRQAYSEVGLNKKIIKVLLRDSLKAIMPTLRNLLRLKGKIPPPIHKEEIINELKEQFNVDTRPFLAILKEDFANIEDLIEDYTTQIKNLSFIVDKL